MPKSKLSKNIAFSLLKINLYTRNIKPTMIRINKPCKTKLNKFANDIIKALLLIYFYYKRNEQRNQFIINFRNPNFGFSYFRGLLPKIK